QWVEEYNTFAPHSALNMKTPNEFYNFKIAA
ncbi:MAG: putative transposase, partial [Algoriphagus sp.]